MAAAAVRRSQLYRDERDLLEAQGRTTAQAEAAWDATLEGIEWHEAEQKADEAAVDATVDEYGASGGAGGGEREGSVVDSDYADAVDRKIVAQGREAVAAAALLNDSSHRGAEGVDDSVGSWGKYTARFQLPLNI